MSPRISAGAYRVGLGLLGLASTVACTSTQPSTDIRQWTDDLAFRISVQPLPPVAEAITTFKIVVQDKETGQPIEGGQGRLFATNAERATSYDGLAKGKEVGTYYARIRFPVSGDWAVGLQFRRDSTKPLERTQDWSQTVQAAPPLPPHKP